MTERTIRFKPEFFHSILDGLKTQTRRPVKFPGWFLDEYGRYGAAEIYSEIECPYGHDGALLTASIGDLARLALVVTNIRVERLETISAHEIAHREGVTPDENYRTNNELVNLFSSSWDAIYKSKGIGWDANPWVWVVEFKRLP